jgi:hypothetical protein
MAAGRFFNDGQEITLEDLNAISAALERQIGGRYAYYFASRQMEAFFGDSFSVSYVSSNQVLVKKGLGLHLDGSQVTPESSVRQIHSLVDQTLTISTPHATLPRVDIVVAAPGIAADITATRNYKDATSGAVSSQTLTVQNDWLASVQIIAGTANASPVAPAVPSGYVLLATLAVAAVSGMAGTGSVTDNRTLMPVGANTTVVTTGYNRLPASTATTIQAIAASIDTFLRFGLQDYTDLNQQDTALSLAEPASPSANRQRLFYRDGTLYLKDSTGAKTPVGSGGGGGGFKWYPPSDGSPVVDEEFGAEVYFYEQGNTTERLLAQVKVPQSYVSGRQISLYLGAYSPSSSNQFKLQAKATLIRKNTDALSSTTNQNTANTGDVTNTVANQYRGLSVILTDAAGAINSVAVSPGDIIKVELTRIAPTGSDDTGDIRLIPNATEVKFS